MPLQEELEQQGNFLFKYRSYIPIILLVVGLCIYAYDRANNLVQYNVGIEIAALSVGLLGLLIRVITVGFTPKNTSGRNTARQVADTLNTKGIYSTVRHPLYVGNFFMYLGIALLTTNLYFVLLFILAFWVYYERIMFAEEQFLRRKFKENYTQWANKVNAFIPNISKWKSADLSFSWKKVFKKEKNGLFALFLVFLLFRILGNYATTQRLFIQWDWLTYATIFTGILYFILKFLKNRTKVLDEDMR